MSLGTINLNEKQRRRLPRFTPSLFVVSPSRSIGQSPAQYLSLWQLFESELYLLPFLFREALLCHSNSRSAAQHTLDAAARMARRTEELLFSSSGRRAIHSRSIKGARPAYISG